MPSPIHADFRSAWCTLDQAFYPSQSIWDGLNILKPGSRTILGTIYFSKAFHSVWNPTSFTSFFLLASFGLFMRPLQGILLSLIQNFTSDYSHPRFTRLVSFSQPYHRKQVEAHPPSG